MKRIISKIDYDMQKLANTDSTLALELWERIKGRKFIIDGALEIVFLNMNSQNFMIGAENTGVSFYDISVITKEDNLEDYNTVLAREEINKYETSSETTKKAIVE